MKKLIHQSWRRGTRENDLLLGTFAEAVLPTLPDEDLRAYEEVLRHEDKTLFAWITGQQPISDPASFLHRIKAFHQCR